MSMAAAQPLHNVFVYGSLLADEVVTALLNRVPQSSPAVLNNQFSIKGRVYPAILPVENRSVTGRVLFGIDAPELDLLDAFEDVEYERKSVEVILVDDSQKLEAHTYIWCNKSDPDLFGEWNFEEWKKLQMEEFVNMTKSFAEEVSSQSKSRVATYDSFYNRQEDKRQMS